jgi:hypothetical protein
MAIIWASWYRCFYCARWGINYPQKSRTGMGRVDFQMRLPWGRHGFLNGSPKNGSRSSLELVIFFFLQRLTISLFG